MNLKTKSSFAVAGLLMLVFGFGVLVQDYLIRSSLERTIADQQFTLVSRVADEIDSRVHITRDALRRVAAGLSSLHVDDETEVRAYLYQNQGMLALFASLIVASPELRVVADMPSLQGRAGADVSGLEHLRRIRETRSPVISRPFLGQVSRQPLIAMSVPVFDSNGLLIAVVSGTLDLLSPNFLGGLNEDPRRMGGHYVLTTRDRVTIMSQDFVNLLRPYAEAGANPVYDRAVGGWEGTGQSDAEGRNMLMSFRSLESTDWIVGVALPVDEAFAPIAQSRRTAVLLLLGATGLVGMLVWFVMRNFLRPLFELRDNVARLRSDPELVGRLKAGDDEIGEVARDFYRLFDNLSRSRQESLARAEELQSILDASPIAIAIIREKLVVRANPAFERMFGFPLEQVLGSSLERHFADQDDFVETRRQIDAASNGQVAKLEHRLVDCLGQPFWANVFMRMLDPGHPDKGTVVLIEDVSEQKMSQERIRYLAEHDPLTNLPNRTLFNDRLSQAIVKAQREQRKMALVFVDLDRFKNINDSLGHHVGDQMLRVVAERIQLSVRASDTVSRPGGDEFILLLPEIEDAEDAARVAEKVLQSLGTPCQVEGRTLMITASIGIGIYPDDGEDMQTLMRNADAAMYHSKESGRNTYHYFKAEMNKRVFERMSLENALRRAIDNNEFLVHFQPQIEGRTGRVIGAEVLVRWRDPEHGMVLPERFIPVAEDTGLILDIGAWVLEEACRQNCAWQDAGLPPIPVAVNISARQFRQPRFTESVRRVLALTGLEPDCLEIELTEGAVIDSVERNIEVLTAIRQMGVKVSIDDFGTGYSSLSYLKRLPIDTLKIDQSFVRDIATDPDDAAIVGAIIALSRSLQLRVVAEGVEDAMQLDFLLGAGCSHVQGYFFSRPLPADEFESFWRRNLAE